MAHHQRSDVCAVPAAGIVAEAMVALVLADAVLEKFGGDSVAETAPQRRGVPRRDPDAARGDRCRPASSSWSGRWARARPPSPHLLGSALGRAASATPTTTSRRPPASRSPTSSSTTARPASGRWSAPPSRRRWRRTPGVLALGGGAVLDPATQEALRGQHAWCSSTSGLRRRQAGRSGHHPPAAGRQPARPAGAARWSAPPIYARGRLVTVHDRRPRPRGRRRVEVTAEAGQEPAGGERL